MSGQLNIYNTSYECLYSFFDYRILVPIAGANDLVKFNFEYGNILIEIVWSLSTTHRVFVICILRDNDTAVPSLTWPSTYFSDCKHWPWSSADAANILTITKRGTGKYRCFIFWPILPVNVRFFLNSWCNQLAKLQATNEIGRSFKNMRSEDRD